MAKKIFYSFVLLAFLANICLAAANYRLISAIHQSSESEKTLYLTLDACGSDKGSGFDCALIDYLTEQKIPATLFLSGRWIDKNPEISAKLAENKLFKIENHGNRHMPASLKGTTVYGIKGTSSKEELADEIMINSERIEKLTGKTPRWYRSGTAYYDTAAVDIIVNEFKIYIAGYAIALDEGAMLTSEKVYQNAMKAKNGFILTAHMNHPESGTSEGLKLALQQLLKEGYVFKLLPDTLK